MKRPFLHTIVLISGAAQFSVQIIFKKKRQNEPTLIWTGIKHTLMPRLLQFFPTVVFLWTLLTWGHEKNSLRGVPQSVIGCVIGLSINPIRDTKTGLHFHSHSKSKNEFYFYIWEERALFLSHLLCSFRFDSHTYESFVSNYWRHKSRSFSFVCKKVM